MDPGTFKTVVYSSVNRSQGVVMDTSEELIPIIQYAIRRLEGINVIAVKITKNNHKIAYFRK